MELKLRQIYSCESYGTHGPWGCEINIHFPEGTSHEPTPEQREAVEKAHELIHDAYMTERIRNNAVAQEVALENQNTLLSLFHRHTFVAKPIPNGYCPKYCCRHLPWFEVQVADDCPGFEGMLKDTITLGWRKRVISISWVEGSSAFQLFPKEDVTKSDRMIHAWTLEKAQEYINLILT